MTALEESEHDSQSLVFATTRRMTDLSRAISLNPHGVTAGELEIEYARLGAKQSQQQGQHLHLASLNANIRQFLAQLGPDVVVGDCKPPSVHLRKGETYVDGVRRVRDAITALKAKQARIRDAALPVADLKALARTWVHDRGQTVQPKMKIGRDTFDIVLSGDSFSMKTDALAVMCWAAPDVIVAQLHAEIDSMPTPTVSMPAGERERHLLEIGVGLLDEERKEEALIATALKQGQFIARRSDVSPTTVLGIVISLQAAKAA